MKKLEYYTEKFSLLEDPILALNELFSRDCRLDGIKQKESNGQYRPLELTDFQQAVRGAQLIPSVPADVRTVFDGAKRLFVFGYFEYYFLSISMHYLFLAAESALRNKYNTLKEEKGRAFVSLKNVVESLVQDGIIPESDQHFYYNVITLRNTMSHLTRPTIYPASKRTFERVAEMINQLYDQQIL